MLCIACTLRQLLSSPAVTMQALESEEARAARRKRVAEKLSSYKKQAGLVVDPVAEAAALEAYNLGQELMREVSNDSTCNYACVSPV